MSIRKGHDISPLAQQWVQSLGVPVMWVESASYQEWARMGEVKRSLGCSVFLVVSLCTLMPVPASPRLRVERTPVFTGVSETLLPSICKGRRCFPQDSTQTDLLKTLSTQRDLNDRGCDRLRCSLARPSIAVATGRL